jgi:hypothetical protein
MPYPASTPAAWAGGSESGPGPGAGPLKTRGLTTRPVRVGRPANLKFLNRAREKASARPGAPGWKEVVPWGVEGAGAHIRARSGVPTDFPPSSFARGQAPVGDGRRTRS